MENTAAVSLTSRGSLKETLLDVAKRYPAELIDGQCRDVPRIAFNIGLVTQRVGTGGSICDLGGGIGLFSAGCAALGMRATLVDDFSDNVNFKYGSVPIDVHGPLGVEVLSCDVVAHPPQFPAGALDAVTSFDSMEHWHRSPKTLLRAAMGWLRPGGLLIIGVPNCVNLRKRLSVPLGLGKWSSMEEWYERPTFRGHVREPDVADLRYLARDLSLENVEIIGRNWLGYHHGSSLVRFATRIMDVPLQAFPSLCADLYLIGTKPAAG